MAKKYRKISHDFETYSDLNPKTVGSDVYSRDPSTEILMCAYSIDEGPIQQWVPAEGEDLPADLEDCLHDEDTYLFAWNSAFREADMGQHCGHSGSTPSLARPDGSGTFAVPSRLAR